MNNHIVTITPGDPNGIGSEVVAKALADGSVQQVCTPVVVGSQIALERGVEIAGVTLKCRRIKDVEQAKPEPGMVDVLDDGVLSTQDIQLGQTSAICGAANAGWLKQAAKLSTTGKAQATVMAPVNSESLALAKQDLKDVFGRAPSDRYLTLLSGPLRIVHLFDHVLLQDVCQQVSAEMVTQAIIKTRSSLIEWGIQAPRIGVAGLNPHAQGPQEDQAIRPGVDDARERGVDVQGPIAPDTIFRHCIDGQYDVVIAMFHDQGHIALKTWGFVGNCALFMGAPFLFLSVGHGTAYDIVGRGTASHEMMLTAMLQAASLAAGTGFID
ncbi:MAG: PdxA family protein [bacterium]